MAAASRPGSTFNARDYVLVALLVLISTLACAIYVQSEHAYYWSDYFTHYSVWQRGVAVMRASPLQWLSWLQQADTEFTPFYTLLNLPAGLMFGTSRLVFVLSILVVYTWPYLILISLLIAKLFAEKSKRIFWVALLAAFFNPLVWSIPLRGYPDYASSCLMAIAWLAYLNDPLLIKRGNAVGVAILLGLAPLVRRHFAYAALASYLSFCTYAAANTPRQGWPRLALTAIMIVIYALTAALIVDYGFLAKVVNVDYFAISNACRMDVLSWARFYISCYGVVRLCVSAIGWWLIFKHKLLAQRFAWLALLYAFLMIGLWLVCVGHVGLHYSTHWEWVVNLGVTACVVKLLDAARRQPAAKAVLALLVVFAGANLLQGLGVPIAGLPRASRWQMYWNETPGEPLGYLLSAVNQPFERTDMPEIRRLCRFLATELGGSARLGVAASSAIFNDELLYNAMTAELSPSQQAAFPQLVKIPQIDYRDDSPIHSLAHCDAIILASPPQFHLLANRQTNLQFTIDSFSRHIGLANDFAPMAEQFHLDHGVTLTIYKRTRAPSVQELYESVVYVQVYEKKPHPMLNPWLVWNGNDSVESLFLGKFRHNIAIFRFVRRTDKPAHVRLIYLGLPQRRTVRVAGDFVGLGNRKAAVSVGAVRLAGAPLVAATVNMDGSHSQFTVPMATTADELISIDVELQPAAYKELAQPILEMLGPED